MKSDMENKDWLNDYMSLKQVSRANPFTVPDGYFNNLGDRIVSAKNLDELKNNSHLDGFTVPENYFDELADTIQSRIAVEDILSKEGHFTVPEGYFDELAANVQSRIAVEDILSKEGHFTVPEGYFDELAQQIQSRIAVEDILSKEGHFTVPEGYFDNLAQQIQSRVLVEGALGAQAGPFTVPGGYFDKLNKNILDKTVETGDGNRKGVVRKLFASTAFKYATAACFAVAIGGGILLDQATTNQPIDHKSTFLHKQLSNVPADEIKSYLQLNIDAGDTQQTVATEGTPVNEGDLKDALQNYVDSVQ